MIKSKLQSRCICIRLLIAVAMCLLTLSTLSTEAATEGDSSKKIDNFISYEKEIDVYPGNPAFQSVRLFDIAGDVKYEQVLQMGDNLTTLSVSGYNIRQEVTDGKYCSRFFFDDFSISDRFDDEHPADTDTCDLLFFGTAEDAKEYYGLTYSLTLKISGNDYQETEVKILIHLKEDTISIRRNRDTILLPGKKENIEIDGGLSEILGVEWTSSDTSVIQISPDSKSKGKKAVLKTVGAGIATISASIQTPDTIEYITEEIAVNWLPGRATLNFSKVTLYKGESVELNLNNLPEGSKVSYKSGKPSVISVDKKTGRMTAKKKGKAVITVTVKAPATEYRKAEKYKLKCTVSVKNPGKVTEISTAQKLKEYLTDGKGGHLKLTADISTGNNFGILIKKGSYRLDLNGHSLRGQGNGTENGIIDVAGGTLTILDSKGKAEFINDYSQEAVGCIKGTLNIYGGNIWGYNYAVYNSGGTTNLYGGGLIAYGNPVKQFGGQLNIYGGYLSNIGNATNSPGLGNYDALYVCGTGKADIRGGEYYGELGIRISGPDAELKLDNCYVEAIRRPLALYGGKTVINGGSYIAQSEYSVNLVPTMDADCVYTEINGGEFISNNRSTVFSAYKKCEIKINGGWYKSGISLPDGQSGWNNTFYFDKTFDGSYRITEALFSEDSIDDLSPQKMGIERTTFTRNSTKYKKGMKVENADDMYSAYMDALENLNTHIEIRCNKELSKILMFYHFESIPARAVSKITADSDINDNTFTSRDGYYTNRFDVKYKENFEIERLCAGAPVKNGSETAQKYYRMLKNVAEECTCTTKLDTAKALHDYMCKKYTYDYDKNSESYYPQGLLDNGKGVCQAYAMMYKDLCLIAGIKCEMLEGYAGEPGSYERHGWNAVEIDGKTLYVDVTFDDTAGSERWCLKDEKTFYSDRYHIQ